MTASQSVHAWIDLMKTADKLLLAGFAREVGAEKATDAYRQWFAERPRDRDHIVRLARRLNEIGGKT